jgi:hypothetical protein
MRLAPPTTAYDLELLKHTPARGTAADHGWCYGLPPGISESQWPLSPYDGFPMQPCFTLKIPEQYRAKGADYVALTMFADQQHDEPSEVEAIADYLGTEASERPADPNLKPYWIYKQNRHPMEFRMKDIIDHNFAAIWLTAAEFAGPLCQPPGLTGNPLLAHNPPPPWLEYGSARATFDFHIGSYDSIEEIANKEWYRRFGRVPDIGQHAYAIGIIPRDGDPNVGHPPRDKILHKDELGAYIAPYSKDAEPFDLAPLSGRNHLGGTMFPCQWTPKFSATYLEIEEHFGGFNFGGGNGQLDLEAMEFDWACG